jgi:hypothetical protein
VTPESLAVNVEIASPRIGMRVYFSTYHLFAARRAAAAAREIERAHDPEQHRPRFDINLRADVTTAVIDSAAFVEAFVNEVCTDIATGHNPDGRYDAVPDAAAHEITTQLGAVIRQESALDKYKLLFRACGQTFDKGRAPAQPVHRLFELRKSLIHYRPATMYADAESELERKLRGKFSDCLLLAGSGNPWWPDHCLGFGCARWAVTSALALTDHVADTLRIVANYQSVDFGNPLDEP